MNKILALVGAVVLVGSAFAVDNYYWQNTLQDNDIANTNNWTKNNQTTVPDTFPPELDTATTGSTHPKINLSTGGTLALPNVGSLTLQDMIFTTADTDWTIDLGSKDKTVKLFGECNAAIWVGVNTPNGQRITLKSGTLERYQDTQRHTSIRFGGSNTTGAKRSYFRLDGPNAQIKNLRVQVASPNCEFCVTNGAYALIKDNYGLRLSSNAGFDCPDSRYIVSGAGSVIEKDVTTDTGFFFGDNLNAGEVYGQGGGLVINDGGAVKKARATIGNRRGGFYVNMDNGSWTEAADIILGQNATSTNNVFTARNGSTVNLTATFYAGSNGGSNRAVFDNSSLTTAGYIYGGVGGAGSGHNELIFTNKSTVSTKFIALGYNTGNNSRYNRVFIDDSAVTLTENFLIGRFDGGNTGIVQNATLACGSTMCVGERTDAGTPGIGYNAIFISNSTFSASTTYVGGQNGGGANACNNSITVMDSTFNESNRDWYMGLSGGGTNHVVIANSTMPIRTFSLGRKGDGYNTALITNCTEFSAGFEIGGTAGVGGSGSCGNVLRFVDTTLGSWDTRTTSICIANSYGSAGKVDPSLWVPSRSNRVEFVRSTWYNSASWFGVGGWNGAQRGEDYNVLSLDDNSLVDLRLASGNSGSMLGYGGSHNRIELNNGSTLKVYSISFGGLHGYYDYVGTNTLYVGKDSLFTCESWFTTTPGGQTIIIEDGTLKARYYRAHYFFSEARQTTLDDLATAEKEYGKTGAEIWGTRWILKGSKPVLCFPLEDAMEKQYSGVEFDRSTYLEIEFPAKPYAAAPLQSSKYVSIADGTNYRFDFSKVEKPETQVDYPIARVEDVSGVHISDAELARMENAMNEAAVKHGLRVTLTLSDYTRNLTMSVKAIKGTVIMIQ